VFNQKNLAIISYSIVHSIERKENLPWRIGMRIASVLAGVQTKSDMTEIVAVGTRIANVMEAESLVTGPVANIVAVVKKRATEGDRAVSMAAIVNRGAEVTMAGAVATGRASVDREVVSMAPVAPTGVIGRARVSGVAEVSMATAVVVRKGDEVVTVAVVMKAPAPAEVSPVAGAMSPAGVKAAGWVIVGRNIVATSRSAEEEVIVRVAEISEPVKAITGAVGLAKRVAAI
jgi:hypothetical protein